MSLPREPTSEIALVEANGGSSHKCAPTDIKFVDLLTEHQVAEHLLGGLFQNKVDAKSLFIEKTSLCSPGQRINQVTGL